MPAWPFRSSFLYAAFSAAVLSLAGPVSANIALGPFSDHMVLQRQAQVPVFGKADPGEQVTVEFRGQSKSAAAAPDGKWMVRLDAMQAGGPFEMTLKGKNTLVLKDVLVGEVWLGSGQSNMEWQLDFDAVNRDSAKSADYPMIRHMSMSKGDGKWHVCTPEAAKYFSAVGYYFAREIHKSLNVPVGIVTNAVGGTEVERWLDPEFISKDSALSKPGFRTQNNLPGDLYAAHIAPVAPYALRGFLWYQGESNTWNHALYRARFEGLVRGWRRVWQQGDAPFYFVQLASYQPLQNVPVQNSGWCEIREAQRLSLSLPATAMATAIDIGEAADIHPKNKYEVGRRLSLPARAQIYGQANLVHSGPLYRSMTVEGNKVRLQFSHAGGGLQSADGGALKGFAIAGSNNVWAWGDAKIEGSAVVVSSPQVAVPTQVRYAWAENPIGNLFNREKLPASSFKTDGPQLPVGIGTVPASGRMWGVLGRIFRTGPDLLGRRVEPALVR